MAVRGVAILADGVQNSYQSRLLQDQFGYRLNTDLFVCEDPNGDHTEASWRRHLPYVLGLFAG